MATLDDLFLTKETVGRGEHALTLRALSDLELQARDEYCLTSMGRRRRLLRDPQSDEYLQYIEWIPDDPEQNLVELALTARRMDLIQESQRDIKAALLPIPDDAQNEEKLEVLEKRKAEDQRVIDARVAFVEAGVARERERLQALERKELEKVATRSQVNFQCDRAWSKAFDEYTLFAGVFQDDACTQRQFTSPEATHEIARDLRSALLSKCHALNGRVSLTDLQYFLSTDASAAGSKASNGAGAEAVPTPTPAPAA
jgi:hypothetical protein